MRRKRQLPEALRPLALLIDLTNLLDHNEIAAFRTAHRQLLETQSGMFRLNPVSANLADPTFQMLRKQNMEAAKEVGRMLDTLVARAQEASHAEALTFLQDKMRWPHKVKLDGNFNPFTIFSVIAAVREALEEVAIGLAQESGSAQLPEECYSPPALLYKKDGVITVATLPLGHWLLPMLDGLEVARLGFCQICGKLFVARRRDQLGCSRKCGDAMYMRRYRRAEYSKSDRPTPNARKSAKRRLSLVKKRS
jgi:hypothetical protein